MKEGEKRTLLLPAELYARLEERAKATGFNSAGEYIMFVLQEVIKEEQDQSLGVEDEVEVKKRLKALGYLG